MKFFTYLLLVLVTSAVVGQNPQSPYQKMELKNTPNLWYETLFDSSLINEKSDGYNSFTINTPVHPIFDKNYMYLIRGVLNRNRGYDGGAIIQKRNINTGEILWSTLYDLNNQPFAEVPFKMYIGEDGFLYVHGFRNRINAVPDFFPFLYFPTDSCYLTYRKLSVETGEVLEFYTPEEDSVEGLYVLASIDKAFKYSNLFLTENPEEFLYWERIITDDLDVGTIRFQKVNKYGIATSDLDSLRLRTPTNQYINFTQLNMDTFVHTNFNRVNQTITLYYYDKHFKLLDSLSLDDFPSTFKTITSSNILDSFIFIQTVELLIDRNRFVDAVYDFNGNLVDYFEFDSPGFLEFWSSFDQIRKKIMIMSSTLNQNPLSHSTSLYETDGNGGIKKIYEFIPSDSLRTIGGLFIYTLNPGKSLIHFSEGALFYDEFNSLKYDNYARAHSFMLFDSESIGLNTVNTETSLDPISVKVKPNPTQDELTIAFGEDINGVLYIVDNLGNVLVQRQIQSERKIILQLDYLQPGMYYLKMEDQLKGVCKKRFIKL